MIYREPTQYDYGTATARFEEMDKKFCIQGQRPGRARRQSWAGRPVLVVPDVIGPMQLRRVVVACKDTRECRRALFFCGQQPSKSWLSKSAKKS